MRNGTEFLLLRAGSPADGYAPALRPERGFTADLLLSGKAFASTVICSNLLTLIKFLARKNQKLVVTVCCLKGALRCQWPGMTCSRGSRPPI